MIPGGGNPMLLSAGGTQTHQIQRSLRLRGSNGAYLAKSFGTSGALSDWGFSAWIKRGTIGVSSPIFDAGAADYFRFNSSDQLELVTGGVLRFVSQAVYRDTTAWYHIIVQARGNLSANTVWGLYVNGVSQSLTITPPAPSLVFNTAVSHGIGRSIGGGTFDGYIAEVNFISNGSGILATLLGSIDPVTGVWRARKYPVELGYSYGPTGFYLPFTNASSLSTLTADSSGNGNHWLATGASLTPGATYDLMIDVPLGNGSDERGNYCTLSPLDQNGATISAANLTASVGSGGGNVVFGSQAMTTGKWYFEVLVGTNLNHMLGIADQSQTIASRTWTGANGWYYYTNGQKYNNGATAVYGASYTMGDIIGVAYDADIGSLTFYKNNISQGVAYNSGLSGKPMVFAFGNGSGSEVQTINVNFGQHPFTYAPPTGFKALHTGNLPDPVVLQPRSHFDVSLFTGTGSAQSITNGGAMRPDLVWIKSRGEYAGGRVVDSVRGVDQVIYSNQPAAEITQNGVVDSFDTAGFTGGGSLAVTSGNAAVAWQWKAGGAAILNSAGSIPAQVSANPTAGFSIVSWTGNGVNATVGHGLGVVPKLIIGKIRGAAQNWQVWHSSLGDNVVQLNLTNAQVASTANAVYNTSNHTSSVFAVGTVMSGGGSPNYVAYCFAEIAGYSKIGAYTGNGAADGPFVYCGFRPRFVMIKASNAATDWYVFDSARDTRNQVNNHLYINLENPEGVSGRGMDFTASGFKFRQGGSNPNLNNVGYIFVAFAEAPFKFALAR